MYQISISIKRFEANIDNKDNNNESNDTNDIKRLNYRLISDLLFGSNNQHSRQETHYFRPFIPKYDNNPRLNSFDGSNHQSIGSHLNFGPKRIVPIGGFPQNFPQNNMWSNGQNGLRFGMGGPGMGANIPHNSPYNQFQPSNQMLNHLMPQTLNFVNTLRAGLKTGIPSYGFGYGIINDGFFAQNNPMNGFPMNLNMPNMPFRSGSSESENDERQSPSEGNPTNKSSQRI